MLEPALLLLLTLLLVPAEELVFVLVSALETLPLFASEETPLSDETLLLSF